MRAVIQRVSKASVSVDGEVTGSIGHGMLVLLGIKVGDEKRDAEKLAKKLVNLRFHNDNEGKMNLSTAEVGGEILVISQFTLYGDCTKGRRPSWTDAAKGPEAQELYEHFVKSISGYGLKVETGVFGAMMDVTLTNAGPVTLIVES